MSSGQCFAVLLQILPRFQACERHPVHPFSRCHPLPSRAIKQSNLAVVIQPTAKRDTERSASAISRQRRCRPPDACCARKTTHILTPHNTARSSPNPLGRLAQSARIATCIQCFLEPVRSFYAKVLPDSDNSVTKFPGHSVTPSPAFRSTQQMLFCKYKCTTLTSVPGRASARFRTAAPDPPHGYYPLTASDWNYRRLWRTIGRRQQSRAQPQPWLVRRQHCSPRSIRRRGDATIVEVRFFIE